MTKMRPEVETINEMIVLTIINLNLEFELFNTVITVNLSVILTLTTLLISVAKNLAQTSYIKWIEYWLIFAKLIPFTQVFLITCLEALKERKGEGSEASTEKCLVAIGRKQVKLSIVKGLNFLQVHPLVPVSPSQTTEEKPLNGAHVISII